MCAVVLANQGELLHVEVQGRRTRSRSRSATTSRSTRARSSASSRSSRAAARRRVAVPRHEQAAPAHPQAEVGHVHREDREGHPHAGRSATPVSRSTGSTRRPTHHVQARLPAQPDATSSSCACARPHRLPRVVRRLEGQRASSPTCSSDSGDQARVSMRAGGLGLKNFTPRLSLGAGRQQGDGQGLEPGDQGADHRRPPTRRRSKLGSKHASSAAGNHGSEETFTVDHPIWSQEEATAIAKARLHGAVARLHHRRGRVHRRIRSSISARSSPSTITDTQDEATRSTASTTSWASPTATRRSRQQGRLHHRPAPRARRAGRSNRCAQADPARTRWTTSTSGCTTASSARTRIRTTSTASRSGCRGSTTATTDQTHWAQLLTPMEGKKFGWYTLPDIDDVVVVDVRRGRHQPAGRSSAACGARSTTRRSPTRTARTTSAAIAAARAIA